MLNWFWVKRSGENVVDTVYRLQKNGETAAESLIKKKPVENKIVEYMKLG